MLSRFRQLQEDLQRQVNPLLEASPRGMVAVKMNGQKQIVDIRIEPEVFGEQGPGDAAGLVRAAVNEACRGASTKSSPTR